MWWMWVVGLAVVIAAVYIIERNRGAKAAAADEDRHRSGPDARSGGGL
jgi:hypothetical protein